MARPPAFPAFSDSLAFRTSGQFSTSRAPNVSARHAVTPAPWRMAFVGGLIGVVLGLVLFAPASLVAAAVERATGGQVQLVGATGTVWNGTARVLLSGGKGSRDSAALPGAVMWRLRPGWLALDLRLTAECCTPAPLQVRLAPGWNESTVRVIDNQSQWPAAVLAGLGTPWNTIQAEGSLQLSTKSLVLRWNAGRLALAGSAELMALGMSSRLSTLRPMGSYRLALTGGDALGLSLNTIEGSLQLSGSGSWVGSRLRFQGEASATPENEAALANLLNIIGRRNGARSIITLG